MDIPGELIVLTLPSLIYIGVGRGRHAPWRDLLTRIGWRGCPPIYFAWALAAAAVLGGFAFVATRSVPSVAVHNPHVTASAYAGWTRSSASFLLAWRQEAIYTTLGEEVFFRGLLGGWLIRRFGFPRGNAAQAVLFLLPHLILLVVSLSFWPLVLVQGVAGWVLGWLRYRSDSILPGWLAHSLVNALGAFITMR